MKSALQRQLDAFGWRAIGFLGALVAVAAGAFLWGLHIEGRVDRVVIQRQHDHRIIERLAKGKPLRPRRQVQPSSKEVQNLEVGSEGPTPKATSGPTGGVQPPKSGSTKPPAPGKGGSRGGGAPTNAPEPRSEPPSKPAPSDPAASPEPASPGTSASEAPGLIGNPGGAVGEVACSATNAVNEVASVRVCSK
jgi:hypothetical protein